MIYIRGTGDILTSREANIWMKERVVIKKDDLKKIRSLARRLGFLKELKALNIEVNEITASRDE